MLNSNGNYNSFTHLKNLIAEPTKRQEFQADFNKKRYARIEKAISTRLVMIPLQFTLDATGRIQSYQQQTNALNYDIIVVGYMANSGEREIIFSKVEKEKPLVYVGDATSLYLTLDEIAGQPQATNPKGQKGVFYLPNAKIFRAGERLSLEIFKTDTTADSEVVDFVIIAYRVLPKEVANGIFASDLPKINEYITKRESPETLALKTKIIFDVEPLPSPEPIGVAEVFTPQLDEPCLVRGFRSTMNNAFVDINLVGDSAFTLSPVPIWSIAGGDEVAYQNYLWLMNPIYVPARVQLRFKVTNPGVAFDPKGDVVGQQINTITCLIDTV